MDYFLSQIQLILIFLDTDFDVNYDLYHLGSTYIALHLPITCSHGETKCDNLE